MGKGATQDLETQDLDIKRSESHAAQFLSKEYFIRKGKCGTDMHRIGANTPE